MKRIGGAVVALASLTSAGCFVEIADLQRSGATGGGPAISCDGAACEGDCPSGTSCVDGCCAVELLPSGCNNAIDISGGGVFFWDGCGEPLGGCTTAADLMVRTGSHPTGGRFHVRAKGAASWSACPGLGSCSGGCGMPGGLGPGYYLNVAPNTTFSLGVADICTPVEVVVELEPPPLADDPDCNFP